MREAHITIVLGGQGAGKTFYQRKEGEAVARGMNGNRGRKVLVFDCNVRSASYDGIKMIDFDILAERDTDKVKAIANWPVNRNEFCRVVNYTKRGDLMDIEQMNETSILLMRHFHDGMLILEDTNQYLYGARQKKFLSEFIRVRHKNVDLVLLLQSWNAPDPRMWGNCSLLRVHKTYDTPDTTSVRNKLQEKYPIVKLAHLIVEHQFEIGNIRYFCYVDLRKNKLRGVSETAFSDACKKFLLLNPGELKRHCALNEISFKDRESAILNWTLQKAKLYLP